MVIIGIYLLFIASAILRCFSELVKFYTTLSNEFNIIGILYMDGFNIFFFFFGGVVGQLKSYFASLRILGFQSTVEHKEKFRAVSL